jgi:DNA-binding PadR family transcriptional regulator
MTVKDEILKVVSIKKAARYSEIRRGLKRPDKTIYVTLEGLQEKGLIMKDEHGSYILTDKGRVALAEAEEMKSLQETYDVISGLTTLDRTALDEGLRLLFHESLKIIGILIYSSRFVRNYETWHPYLLKATQAGNFIWKARLSLGFDSLEGEELGKSIENEIRTVKEELGTPGPDYPSAWAIDGDRLDASFLMGQVERTMEVASQLQDIFKGSEPVRRFVELLFHAYLDPLRELTRKLATQNEKPLSQAQEPSPSPTDEGPTSAAPLRSS